MQNVIIPTDRQIYEGAIATYWFEDDVLVSLSKGIKRTVPLIAANVELVKSITGGRPVPLLIYLASSPMPDKATQRFSTEKLPEIYTAMAMVSKPGLAQFIMKLLFRFKASPIPMKSFTSSKDAMHWLKSLDKR